MKGCCLRGGQRKKVFCTAAVDAILVGHDCMKKVFLIITLSLFCVTASVTTPSSGSVVFAQKKDKDEKKKDPPGPPVIRDKERQEKPKEPPPKKDKKPS